MGRPNGRDARTAGTDVGRARERRRQGRLIRLLFVLLPLWVWLTARAVTGEGPPTPSLPQIDPLVLVPGLFFVVLTVVLLGTSVGAGRSPHVLYNAEQIDVRMDDVRGIDAGARGRPPLAGAVPRRADLPPRDGRDAAARAALRGPARAPGRPTWPRRWPPRPACRSSSSRRRPSSRCTTAPPPARSARTSARCARLPGPRAGRSASSRRSTPSPLARGGLGALHAGGCGGRSASRVRRRHRPCGGLTGAASSGQARAAGRTVRHGAHAVVSEGVGGVVNELLVQLQSFDTPTGWQRAAGRRRRRRQPAACRRTGSCHGPGPSPSTSCSSPPPTGPTASTPPCCGPAASTAGSPSTRRTRPAAASSSTTSSRAKSHEAAARRRRAPGRARRDHPGLHARHDRAPARRGAGARACAAARRRCRGRTSSTRGSWSEVGLGQPVGYTDHEKRLIATHEAGHAVVAWLVAPHRRLEVLTIVKRAGALGTARARRPRGRLHPLPAGVARPGQDRVRRAGRRGALLRRRLHRARG